MTVAEETISFTSLRTEFLLNLVPDRRLHHADGTSDLVPGRWVQFEHGRFDATDEAARKVGYDTVDELIEALREAPSFGSDFYEIRVEPTVPAPTETLIEIARLVGSGDIEALVQLEAEEKAGWGREPVLQAIDGALDALRDRARQEG